MQHMLSAWKIGQSSSSYWSRIWNLAIQLERVKGVTKTVIFSLWHVHTYLFPKFLMVPMYLPHFQSYCKIVRIQSEFEYDFIESFVPLWIGKTMALLTDGLIHISHWILTFFSSLKKLHQFSVFPRELIFTLFSYIAPFCFVFLTSCVLPFVWPKLNRVAENNATWGQSLFEVAFEY